jgi:hypothetical protein
MALGSGAGHQRSKFESEERFSMEEQRYRGIDVVLRSSYWSATGIFKIVVVDVEVLRLLPKQLRAVSLWCDVIGTIWKA